MTAQIRNQNEKKCNGAEKSNKNCQNMTIWPFWVPLHFAHFLSFLLTLCDLWPFPLARGFLKPKRCCLLTKNWKAEEGVEFDAQQSIISPLLFFLKPIFHKKYTFLTQKYLFQNFKLVVDTYILNYETILFYKCSEKVTYKIMYIF